MCLKYNVCLDNAGIVLLCFVFINFIVNINFLNTNIPQETSSLSASQQRLVLFLPGTLMEIQPVYLPTGNSELVPLLIGLRQRSPFARSCSHHHWQSLLEHIWTGGPPLFEPSLQLCWGLEIADQVDTDTDIQSVQLHLNTLHLT